MSLGERIKKVRRELDLTQQKFAAQIGTTQNALTGYETGRRKPSSAVINNLCKTFNINENWLRTGEGEMFIPSPNGVLDELAQKYGLSDRGKMIVARFLDLKPDIQEAVADYIENLAAAFFETTSAISGQERTEADAPEQARPELDIAAELAELKRQNQELAAEIAAMKEEERDEQLKADFGAALSALQSGLAGNSDPPQKAKK